MSKQYTKEQIFNVTEQSFRNKNIFYRIVSHN